MLELGQLERRHEDFSRRNTRIIVVSVEGQEDAKKTQADFPHLLVLADDGRGLSSSADLIHAKSAPDGNDTSAPTTILLDRQGIVRWLYRSPGVMVRLSPDEVLQEIDQRIPGSTSGSGKTRMYAPSLTREARRRAMRDFAPLWSGVALRRHTCLV
jgi:peroxiredoxin